MSDAVTALLAKHEVRLDPALGALFAALPEGADLGTFRLIGPEEIAERALRWALSPALLPVAEGGSGDLFALYVPPEPGAIARTLCVVNPETGVYAPFASIRGLAAWALLVRQAQASLPAGPAFAVADLLEETRPAASALAGALGLAELLEAKVNPNAQELAARLSELEPACAWACSLLSSAESSATAAVDLLSPALSLATFSAGLMAQAGQALLAAGEKKRAARSLLAALSRLEPNLQAMPCRIDEPDPESRALFEPLRPVSLFKSLRSLATELTPEQRQQTPFLFLNRTLAQREDLLLEPAELIDQARRIGLKGDLPGSRWALHLGLGEHVGDPAASRPLLEELAQVWELAGSRWYSQRFRALVSAPPRANPLGTRR